MKKNRILIAIIACLILCGSVIKLSRSSDSEKKQVVFLNNLMGMSHKLEEYEKSFEELHPDIDIKIESIGDQYENISVIRLNSNNAGDIMIIPSYMNLSDYPDYYEPLYNVADALKKYRFSDIKAIDDKVYSIPLSMDVSGGILFDMKVLNDAGIEKIPESLDELKETLKAVKSKTDAVPLYSNARGDHELTYWNSLVYSIEENSNYENNMIYKRDIFSSDNGYYNVYRLLYESVSENLIEKPFVSSKWNDGLELIQQGNLGAAVVSYDMYKQAKECALNSDFIVYSPLKSKNNGYYLYGKPSYGIGINKESDNKEEAKIWLEYLLENTDFLTYAGDPGMLVDNHELNFEKYADTEGYKIIYPDNMSEEDIGKFEKIDNEACLGIYGGSFAFNLINAASDGKSTYNELCNDWNNRWNSAVEELNKK